MVYDYNKQKPVTDKEFGFIKIPILEDDSYDAFLTKCKARTWDTSVEGEFYISDPDWRLEDKYP